MKSDKQMNYLFFHSFKKLFVHTPRESAVTTGSGGSGSPPVLVPYPVPVYFRGEPQGSRRVRGVVDERNNYRATTVFDVIPDEGPHNAGGNLTLRRIDNPNTWASKWGGGYGGAHPSYIFQHIPAFFDVSRV